MKTQMLTSLAVVAVIGLGAAARAETPAQAPAAPAATPAADQTQAPSGTTEPSVTAPAEPTAVSVPATPGTEASPMTAPAAAPAATMPEPKASAPAAAPTATTTASATVETPASTAAIERSGMYFGFGLASGVGSFASDDFSAKLGSLSFRSGLAIMSNFLVGAEFGLLGHYNTWAASETAGTSMSSLIGQATYYPLADKGLALQAGAGWGSALQVSRLANNRKGDTKVAARSGNGIAWMASAGWDFFPGEGTNLGVAARYDGASLGDLGASHGVSLALSMTWF